MNKMNDKPKKEDRSQVSEPCAEYVKSINNSTIIPEGYMSSDDFWKLQTEKTKEFCKKNGIL